ncbi:MAG: DEAD/DEAH box helicase [Fuerstiella sp.]
MARRRGNSPKAPLSSEFADELKALGWLDAELRENILESVLSGDLSAHEVIDYMKSVPADVVSANQQGGRRQSNDLSAAESSANEMHEQWKMVVDAVGEDISDADWDQARQGGAVVTLKQIHPQRKVAASVKIGRKKAQQCHVAIDPEESEFSYDCSCAQAPCGHLASFVLELISELEDFQSAFCIKIFGKKEAMRQQQQLLNLADQRRKKSHQKLFSTLAAFGDSENSLISLDQQTEVISERVRFNLHAILDNYYPHLDFKAVIQKEKKSGGWGRGRETPLKKFMEMSRESWTSIDHEVASHIQYDRWSYNVEYSFHGIFSALSGTSVFQLNRQPASIEVRPLEIVVLDDEGGGWVLTTSASVLRNEWGDETQVLTTDEGLVVISEAKSSVCWTPLSKRLVELVNLLTTDDIRFQKNERDLLLMKLNLLEATVPVRLPPSLVSEERPVEVDSTLLLRMKKTGSLEATLCVRDDRQLLLLPNEGQQRRLEVVADVPVQFVRDGQSEILALKHIENRLSLDRFFSSRNSTWLIDDPEAVIDLLKQAGELVDEGSLVLIWHKESVKQINVVGALSSANVSVNVTKQRDWFNVNGSCRFGDQEILLQDVLAGLRGATSMKGLVEVSAGQWASIADDFRATLQQLADAANENRGKLQLDQAAAMSLSTIEDDVLDIKADKAWKQCLDKVRSIESIHPSPPAALDCELRDYQVEGFRWMCRLAEWGVGGVLADDMGLGKTVQTLALLLERIETGPALVIAPTSLGFNWESECHKFSPSLAPKLLREADRKELVANASEGDVIICSYGLALRESELLQTVDWGTLVLDEAQNVKNSNTKTAKEVRKLSAGWKVALTGTPMENHLGELWSLFRAVSPGVLGSWEQFRKKFAAPIEKENNDERRLALSRVIAPFILRRSKKDVLTDLPDRSESNLVIELTQQEQERYDQVRLAAVGELDELGSENLSTDQRFKVLQLLTRLRQIACHVSLIDDDWKEGSSKLRMLLERLEQLKERGHRVLIFSQFTSHLGLIKDACDEAGFTYQYLDGQTTPKARQQRVDAFQGGDGDLFLISLKAGGTGLNLTAADYVIHMDPWWNPAVEDQATDRAHRIGQKKNVMVYRFIAKGTIEEQIISLHAEKRNLVEGILSGAEASGKMSTEQLATLIREGVTAKS